MVFYRLSVYDSKRGGYKEYYADKNEAIEAGRKKYRDQAEENISGHAVVWRLQRKGRLSAGMLCKLLNGVKDDYFPDFSYECIWDGS